MDFIINAYDINTNDNYNIGDERMKEAEIFRTPQVECPYCGEIFDLDYEQINDEVTCYECDNTFITKDS